MGEISNNYAMFSGDNPFATKQRWYTWISCTNIKQQVIQIALSSWR